MKGDNMNRNNKKDNKNKSGYAKPQNNRNNKGRDNRGNYPSIKEEADYKKNFEVKTGNPAGDYFTDQALAEDSTSVSNRNILDSKFPIYDTDINFPTIIAYAMNTSVSTRMFDIKTGATMSNAINIAATKLLVALISNIGRVQNYSKSDIEVLIVMIGQYIAMTEHARRVFGLVHKFEDINRDIPRQFIEACGYEFDDFIKNIDSYRSQMNGWINLANQIVIPMDRISYFRRCRDMYKDIYQDTREGETVYHMMVPFSTWLMDEFGGTGTRLKTVNVTGPRKCDLYCTNDTFSSLYTNFGISYTQPHSVSKFQDFLDNIYVPMIQGLLNSATFNNIYSDMRNPKFTSQYNFDFWHAELIDRNYQAEVKIDETMLSIFHNMDVVGAPVGYDKVLNSDGEIGITPLNNVYVDPVNDELAYNPVFLQHQEGFKYWHNLANDNFPDYIYINRKPIILDFKDKEPALDLRVDAMVNKYSQIPAVNGVLTQYTNYKKYTGIINYILPPFYCVQRYTYSYYLQKQYTSRQLVPWNGMSDEDYNNGWFPLNVGTNAIMNPIARTNDSSTPVAIAAYDCDTDTFDATVPNVMRPTSKFYQNNAILNYVDGISFALLSGETENDLVVTNARWIHYSKFSGNVDNWYTVPLVKLVNFFNHVYQRMFTADDITK